MENNLNIIVPELKDFEEISKIARQVHDIHVAWDSDLFVKTEYPIDKERFSLLINEEKIFVIKTLNQILGYVIIDFKESNFIGMRYRKVLKIENIGIDESSRGKGLGTALLKFIKEKAKDNKCTDIYLSVNQKNEKAIRLYEKMGFTVKNISYQLKLEGEEN